MEMNVRNRGRSLGFGMMLDHRPIIGEAEEPFDEPRPRTAAPLEPQQLQQQYQHLHQRHSQLELQLQAGQQTNDKEQLVVMSKVDSNSDISCSSCDCTPEVTDAYGNRIRVHQSDDGVNSGRVSVGRSTQGGAS